MVAVKPVRVLRVRPSVALDQLLLAKGLTAVKVWVKPTTAGGVYRRGHFKTVRKKDGEEVTEEHKPLEDFMDRGYYAIVYVDENDLEKWYENEGGQDFRDRQTASLMLANFEVPLDEIKKYKSKDGTERKVVVKNRKDKTEVGSLGKHLSNSAKTLIEEGSHRVLNDVQKEWGNKSEEERKKFLRKSILSAAAEMSSIILGAGLSDKKLSEIQQELDELDRSILRTNGRISKLEEDEPSPERDENLRLLDKSLESMKKRKQALQKELRDTQKEVKEHPSRLPMVRMLAWHIENSLDARLHQETGSTLAPAHTQFNDDLRKIIEPKSHAFDKTGTITTQGAGTKYFDTLAKVASGDLVVPRKLVKVIKPNRADGKPRYEWGLDESKFGQVVPSSERKDRGANKGAQYLSKEQWDTLLAEVMGSRLAIFDEETKEQILAPVPFEGEVPDGEWAKSYWDSGAMSQIHKHAFHYMKGPAGGSNEAVNRLVSAGLTGAIHSLMTFHPSDSIRKGLEPRSAMAAFGHIAGEVSKYAEVEAIRITGEQMGEERQASMDLQKRQSGDYKRFRILAHAINSARENYAAVTGQWVEVPPIEAVVEAAKNERYNIEKLLRERLGEDYDPNDKAAWEKWVRKEYNKQVKIRTDGKMPAGVDETHGAADPDAGDVFVDARILANLENPGSVTGVTSGSPGPMSQVRTLVGWKGPRPLRNQGYQPFDPARARFTGDPDDSYTYRVDTGNTVHPSQIATLEMQAKTRQQFFDEFIKQKFKRKNGRVNITPKMLEAIDMAFFPGLPLDFNGTYEVDTSEYDRIDQEMAILQDLIDDAPKSVSQLEKRLRRPGHRPSGDYVNIEWHKLQAMKQANIKRMRQLEAERRELGPIQLKVPTVMPLHTATMGQVNFPGRIPGNVKERIMQEIQDLTGRAPKRRDTGSGIDPIQIAYHLAMREVLERPQYNSARSGTSTADLKENGQTLDIGPLGPLFPPGLEHLATLTSSVELGKKTVRRRVLRARYGTESVSPVTGERISHTRYAQRSRDPRREMDASAAARAGAASSISRLASEEMTPGVSSPVMERERRIAQSRGRPKVLNHEKLQTGNPTKSPWDDVHDQIDGAMVNHYLGVVRSEIERVRKSGLLTPGHHKAIPAVHEMDALRRGYTPTTDAAKDPGNPANWEIPMAPIRNDEGKIVGERPYNPPAPVTRDTKKNERRFAERKREDVLSQKRVFQGVSKEVAEKTEVKERASTLTGQDPLFRSQQAGHIIDLFNTYLETPEAAAKVSDRTQIRDVHVSPGDAPSDKRASAKAVGRRPRRTVIVPKQVPRTVTAGPVETGEGKTARGLSDLQPPPSKSVPAVAPVADRVKALVSLPVQADVTMKPVPPPTLSEGSTVFEAKED